ncbi:SGNH/GDSL hydrolase family protein [Flavobacterium sp. FZUC8N2.13]|uniref:SGNH/GDSL hydrolase family protein n=1 Tax=Flavobacterium zubiriense TaxID=3138075 RepID=A0ABV4TAX5_9FLAO
MSLLNWADKKNSPNLADFITKYGSEYCLTAEEINAMRDAVNEMATIQQSVFLGTAEPDYTPTGNGRGYWIAIKAGTYANYGSVVLGANEIAFIIRDAAGAFTISKSTLDLSTAIGPQGPQGQQGPAGPTGPAGTANMVTWSAIAFASGSQVNHLGKDWVANANTVAGDVPGTSSKWVERLSGYAIPTVLKSAVKNVNLVTGNIRANQGIVYNTAGTYSNSNTDYDALVLPIDANTIYKISGFFKSAGTILGFFREDSVGSGTFTKVPESECYLFSYFNKTRFLLGGGDLSASENISTFKTPNISGLFLIINTRWDGSNTASTLIVNKSPFVAYEQNDQVQPTAIGSKEIEDAHNYFLRNKTEFDLSVKSAVVSTSAVESNTKNLFNEDNIAKGWGVVYNTTNGITANDDYDCAVIPVTANAIYTISGDLLAKDGISGGQNYFFGRLTSGKYVPIADSELTTYYPENGATSNKAYRQGVRPALTTFQVPNVSGDLFLVLNTRFLTFNNKSTLQVEQGIISTFYANAKSSTLKDFLGYSIKPKVLPQYPYQWEGKRIYFFGDSVTSGTYPSIVGNNLNCNIVNYGSSGSDTLRMYNIVTGTGYPLPNYNMCHAVVLMIGHNGDSGGNGTVADITTAPYPSTFWGNVGKTIEYFQVNYPSIKIYFSTLHLTDRDSYNNSKTKSNLITDICEYYSIPVIDTLRTCGINKKNIMTYVPDLTHPNASGDALIAKALSIGLTSK